MGRIFRIAIASGLALSFALSCGKTEKVEGIKGPEGNKGPTGDKGPNGDQGPQGQPGNQGNGNGNGQYPNPNPTYTPNPYPNPNPNPNPNGGGDRNLPPTNPYPPIIIVLPTQECNRSICPQGTMLVCACIEAAWQTVSILPSDQAKFRIRNFGRCEDYNRQLGAGDCIWWPRTQPQPQPIPTVTVTAYPIPYPTITVFPRPNQC